MSAMIPSSRKSAIEKSAIVFSYTTLHYIIMYTLDSQAWFYSNRLRSAASRRPAAHLTTRLPRFGARWPAGSAGAATGPLIRRRFAAQTAMHSGVTRRRVDPPPHPAIARRRGAIIPRCFKPPRRGKRRPVHRECSGLSTPTLPSCCAPGQRPGRATTLRPRRMRQAAATGTPPLAARSSCPQRRLSRRE